MRGVLVLGPRGVALLVAVLALQSGLIAYLLYPHAGSDLLPACDDSASSSLWPQVLPLALVSPTPGRPSNDVTQPHQPSSKRPVVLGMATGYQWNALRNFVVSLRYTGFTGDVVLFVAPDAQSDDELMQRLRFYNVTVVAVQPKFPYFEQGSLPHMMIERLLIPPMPELKAMNRRFHIMQLWLSAYGSFYNYVFITDTRDVVFQKDPFDWAYPQLEDKLYVTLENPWFTIAKHGTNAGWVALAFGHSGYDEIKGTASMVVMAGNVPATTDEKIICSGTTFGSTDQMLWYLQRMNAWIKKIIDLHEHRERSAVETVDRDIFDQAIHMYIVYKLDWGGKLVRLENAKSPVITLAAFGEFKKQSPPLQILNDDGVVANVVHQYDRYQDLVDTFDVRNRFLERQSFLFNVSLASIEVRQ